MMHKLQCRNTRNVKNLFPIIPSKVHNSTITDSRTIEVAKIPVQSFPVKMTNDFKEHSNSRIH
jgi:hypothetical protein